MRRLSAMKLESEGKLKVQNFNNSSVGSRWRISKDNRRRPCKSGSYFTGEFIIFQQAMKRQIAIRKSLGDFPACTKLLNEYLKLFAGDTDAWHELGDILLSQQQ